MREMKHAGDEEGHEVQKAMGWWTLVSFLALEMDIGRLTAVGFLLDFD